MASTMSAGVIARVSGIFSVKLVPLPGTVVSEIAPPIASILSRTMSMPTPRPEMLVTAAAVEKSGAKINRPTSSSESSLASLADTSPLAIAFSQIFCTSRPRPSSETSMVI